MTDGPSSPKLDERLVEKVARALVDNPGCTGGCSRRPCVVDEDAATAVLEALSPPGTHLLVFSGEELEALLNLFPAKRPGSQAQTAAFVKLRDAKLREARG